MTELEAAWFAGILDGEGSLMILPVKRRGFDEWHASITIVSTDDRILPRCKDLAQGTLSRRYAVPGKNAKAAAIWQIKGKQLDALLAAVRPHLVAKSEQADILMALRREQRVGALPGNKGVKTASVDTKHRREQFRLAVKALNHRGSSPIPAERLEALAWVRAWLEENMSIPLSPRRVQTTEGFFPDLVA